MINFYRKIPQVVSAAQWTSEDDESLFKKFLTTDYTIVSVHNERIIVEDDIEQMLIINKGDYLIKDELDRFIVVPEPAFKRNYQKI